MGTVIGAALMVIWLVVVFPLLFLLATAAVAAMLGGSLRSTVAAGHEGSELLDLNR
jgi:hypothetical protein